MRLRYIAMVPRRVWDAATGHYVDRLEPMSSYRAADSMYDTPAKAARFAGSDGKVLVLDLDKLEEYKKP